MYKIVACWLEPSNDRPSLGVLLDPAFPLTEPCYLRRRIIAEGMGFTKPFKAIHPKPQWRQWRAGVFYALHHLVFGIAPKKGK